MNKGNLPQIQFVIDSRQMVALTAILPKACHQATSTLYRCNRSIPLISNCISHKQRIVQATRQSFPVRAMSSVGTFEQKLKALEELSACDISDALLKLQNVPPGGQPRAGQLADISPISPYIGRQAGKQKIIAPAVTFQFIPKGDPSPSVENPEANGFPPGKHWVDWNERGTVAVLNQPPGQYCAVLGGIMAARMSYLGVKCVVVNGRVRDLAELSASGLHVWSKATTTVGTGAEAKAGLRNVPIDFNGVTVKTGDIVFCDPLEGVVVIPQELLDDVLELCPKLIDQDEKVKADVENGLSVFEAMQKHRNI
ncbi:DlpA domain protein [Talaromyces proteolyticus]|uniref:DlpA domain protein n=1 Tax=Talaromyces proteolyticus TaxID=1131652 RepID=A0AAD4KWK0_9EURO|nr:DlpA domain protein [Talaromyces proteolyticus]KAH8697629.1 DlpA domain protein [Talaromyces proteolyticus]